MRRRTPDRAFSPIALAAVAVGLALVGSTVAAGSVLGGPAARHGASSRPTGPGSPLHRTRFTAPAIPDWIGTGLLVMLGLAVLAALVYARGARRARQRRLQYDDEEAFADEDWTAYLRALREAATEQLYALAHGAPRNAIVACWMRLQDATGHLGVAPEPAETSSEFAMRVMRGLRLDDAAIDTLSALYREARFSVHEMSEAQRAEAVRALTVLVGSLEAGRPTDPVAP